ncbi:hypothetical protein C0J08_10220 [Marinomonas sp. CT5]|uniref:hypothetical protein n=1 Tax=Marinomonas sp. CT5 TaxID=2066133 RepID=UPI001BAE759B|nr:hypothetical protein [Marinomonas sp. CT5]QUX98137.1 hypothetical protein C0J08_10220 [Marinomonas sp. CT5]
MPRSRKEQVSLEDTPYYHCVARCVRRAFLCGDDPATGNSYEHRRGWIEKRLLFLASVFSIDICAYAVMSNHLHVVLHVGAEKAQSWSTLVLYPFVGNPRENMPDGLPFELSDYLVLVDMTGRIIREDKRGSINASLLPILKRLNIASENWLCIATEFGERTGAVVGAEQSIAHYCGSNKLNRKPRSSYNQLLA